MLFDLQIDDCIKKTQYRKLLFKKNYGIGRSIKNDIVILDREIPLFWKKIKRQGFHYMIDELPNPTKHENKFLISVEYSRFFYIACLIIAASIAYGLYILFNNVNPNSLLEQEVFLPGKSSYGVLNDQELAKLKIKFYFNQNDLDKITDKQLHFSVGNINDTDQLSVFINQQLIGYAQASGFGSWAKEQRLRIPKDIIHKGKNEIHFQLQRKDIHEKKWGVRNIYIEQTVKNTGYDLDEGSIRQYLENFLKLPSPDENDYKRFNTMRLKYKQLKVEKNKNFKPSTLDKLFEAIEYQEEQFFKTKSLVQQRHKQLLEQDNYDDEEYD
ncbi:MAG TPA: hypothetical protein PKC21_09075 [Oligoflexia bacterium]|nr:hypothetical protein [Oligoflexia bacterium]HMR25491.1 hypothetical protein [Oligoflexia bacterium]